MVVISGAKGKARFTALRPSKNLFSISYGMLWSCEDCKNGVDVA